MAEKEQFDLVVVGGGPGGYTAAFRAADLGLRVCLVEKDDQLGGVCLHVGCIPSKTLLHASLVMEEAEQISDFGINFTAPIIDIERLRAKKESLISKLASGLESLGGARKIVRIIGTAKFTSSTTLAIYGESGERLHKLDFVHAIIGTGSRPFALPKAPSSHLIWDSTTALAIPFIPEKLLIIGGGIIGLEMAQVYHSLGSKITIVEMQDQIIPPADKDMVQPLFLKLKKRYQIKTTTQVSDIIVTGDMVQVEVDDGRSRVIENYDAVLVAVGRQANSENLGCLEIGIKIGDKGFIEVDERQSTSVGNIFAVGDVVGEPMLAHKASHQGRVAAEVISGKRSAFTPLSIPSVAYTNPEIAWVGVTEKEAKEQGIEYEKGKFNWAASGRALSSAADIGASKVLFNKETGRLIGAAICGLNGGELIHEALLAQEMGADAEDISKTIHAHPTLSETFAFACEMVDGSITDALPPKKK